MWHRLIQANQFFSKSWRIMAFQPVLYFFVFGASIRLWVNETEPPNFKDAVADNFYGIWLFLGISSPILALISWIMIQKFGGRSTYIGFWVRLSSDIGMFTNLVTYHIVSVRVVNNDESSIYSRYIIGSTLIFVFSLIIRDLWTIYVMERLAGQINSNEKERE